METSVWHQILEGFDYIGGTSSLVNPGKNMSLPILGGAAIILMAKLFDKELALNWNDFSGSLKEPKWVIVGLFLLTLIPKLAKAMMMYLFN